MLGEDSSVMTEGKLLIRSTASYRKFAEAGWRRSGGYMLPLSAATRYPTDRLLRHLLARLNRQSCVPRKAAVDGSFSTRHAHIAAPSCAGPGRLNASLPSAPHGKRVMSPSPTRLSPLFSVILRYADARGGLRHAVARGLGELIRRVIRSYQVRARRPGVFRPVWQQ